MTVSIPDALRAIAWLLQPVHFYALYSEQILVHLLALFALAVLVRRTLRRYRRALAALLLSTALLSAAPPARRSAATRSRYTHPRLVHAAHAPRRPVRKSAAATAARDAQTAVATTAERAPAASERMPTRPVPRQATRGISEAQLLAIANDKVIGPLIDACRQAAGGAR
jgi:hypothetical protein